jgi:glyoxylase-like metal-dependent hydrolase (beta-lactamase superfamily II)/predicted ester cyclase
MATTTRDAGAVAHDYFHAIRRNNPQAQRDAYAADATINISGILEEASLEELIAYFTELWAAVPDFEFEVLSIVASEEQAACQWRMTGTFAGGPLMGFESTGARIDLTGIDLITVRDGRIVHNDAYADGMTIAQQLGVMPETDSGQERAMKRVVNARTRFARRVTADPEEIAEGVWIVRGGLPSKDMNVYLVRDGDGVLAFDAGIRQMAGGVAAGAASLGGLTRIVLGHAHADHRGVAPLLGVPVYIHADDKADAEGDGGEHYFDYSKLNALGKRAFPRLLKFWDGGPVKIAGTVSEGDDVAGFEVVHLPGHAPGLIGLWRASDRLALTSDCFYTLDPQTGRRGDARVPHAAFNKDTEQARESIRKLAALEPAAAWPGHAEPLTGDVRGLLERAAETT